MARGHRGGLDDRARDPRKGSRRAVHHGRRDHLVRSRARNRGRRRAAPARSARPGLQPRLPAAHKPRLCAVREPARRVRGREDGQRAPDVARGRTRVLPRAACRARRARFARRAHVGGDPVHGVHGDRHDRERVLPALPSRRPPSRGRARATDAGPRCSASSSGRVGVRHPRASRRARARDPRRAARPGPVRAVELQGDAREVSVVVRDCRRRRSCRVRHPSRAGRGAARRLRARRRAIVRPGRGASVSCGGTSQSSRSTCS